MKDSVDAEGDIAGAGEGLASGVADVGEASRRDALAERLFSATIGALDLLHVYVGDQLGLYKALAVQPSTAGELARRCGIDMRYAREWLEQQAVAGILAADEAADPDERRFSLPSGHGEVLLDGDSLSFLAPLGSGIVSLAQALPRVLEAFRTGGGVPARSWPPRCTGSCSP